MEEGLKYPAALPKDALAVRCTCRAPRLTLEQADCKYSRINLATPDLQQLESIDFALLSGVYLVCSSVTVGIRMYFKSTLDVSCFSTLHLATEANCYRVKSAVNVPTA